MKKELLLLPLILFFVGGHSAVSASEDFCWEKASQRHRVESRLLRAIAVVESGMDPRARNTNRNGTYDIGLMQINSMHLPALASKGITEESLLSSPCQSIMEGAGILSDMMSRFDDRWEAVGAYNAGTAPGRKALRMRYARRIWEVYRSLN